MGACSHCGRSHDVYATVCPTTGRPLVAPTYTVVNEDEVLLGTVVGGRYQIRDIVGQGGTGTVFVVEHTALPRLAALKVLRTRRLLADSLLRVLESDVYAAAGVSHACLPEIFDVGVLSDGAPYLAMERLEGETLAARAARSTFSFAAAVDMIMQVLSALDALHAADVVVGDLRPQNVFLAHRRGCRALVKLLDVGLQRLTPIQAILAEWDALYAATGHSASGLLAAPSYLAPEIAAGGAPDRRADLFSAGALFYEALTGERAFGGDTVETILERARSMEPTPLTEHRPELPEALDVWLSRALSKSPRDRFGSAREMQDELRGACEGARPAQPQRTRSSSSMMAVAVALPAPLAPPLVAPPRRGISSSAPPAVHAAIASLEPPRLRDSDASIETPFGLSHPFDVPDARPAIESTVDTLSPTTRRTGGAAIQQAIASALAANATAVDPPSEELTEIAVQVELPRFDEASAENPVRTVRPPVGTETVVTRELRYDPEGTVPGPSEKIARSLRDPEGTLPGAPGQTTGGGTRRIPPADAEEEETQTLPLSPELRAQVDEALNRRR